MVVVCGGKYCLVRDKRNPFKKSGECDVQQTATGSHDDIGHNDVTYARQTGREAATTLQ